MCSIYFTLFKNVMAERRLGRSIFGEYKDWNRYNSESILNSFHSRDLEVKNGPDVAFACASERPSGGTESVVGCVLCVCARACVCVCELSMK